MPFKKKDLKQRANVTVETCVNKPSSGAESAPSSSHAGTSSTASSSANGGDGGGWSGYFLRHANSQETVYETARTSLSMISSQGEGTRKSHLALAALRFEAERLYGRSRELELLQKQLVKDGADANRPVVIMVAGVSGVGKSALVDKATKKCVKDDIVATGKYDFLQQTVPYLGITEACQKIVEKHLQMGPSAEQQRQLQDELGGAIHALKKLLPLIPELAGLRNDDNKHSEATTGQAQPDSGVGEAQNRFIFAMGAFLRVVTSWKPIVMVLDDLQWADVESLHLLETLVNDPNMKGLTIIGCYRSNEVDDTHLLSQMRRDLASSEDVAFTMVQLSELDTDAVNDMLMDVLKMDDAEQTKSLASVVHKKTHGNAFFVIQYLKMLQQSQILDFNLGLMKWTWSLEEIESKTAATENVVDLMRTKMQRLPSELCEVLPLAACLGSTFTKRNLSVVVEAFQNQRGYEPKSSEYVGADRWLLICADEGFIEQVDPNTYRWVHDKVQEAALALIVSDKLNEVQYRVGQVLLQQLEEAEITAFVFVVVNLLNKGIENTDMKAAKRLQLARLNLQAGQAAMASASFGQAVQYLQNGIKCLPDDHWVTEYGLSLELFSAAAEAEYCTGATEPMEEHCNAIIAQDDRPVSDKFRAYNVLIPSIGNRNRPAEASDLLVEHLKELGCTFPKRGQLFHVLGGIMMIKRALKKYQPKDFAALKLMEDETKIHEMRMLDNLVTFSYFVEGSVLLPLSVFKSFRYTLDYGICEYSPAAFALVGMIMIVKLRDWQGGRAFAEHALSMVGSNLDFERVESRAVFLVHAFTLHQCIPHHMCLKPLLHGYATGLATGDTESAAWNLYHFLECSYYSGNKTLKAMDDNFDIYGKQFKAISQLKQYVFSLYERQVVQNLLGLASDSFKLKGDVFDIDAMAADRYLLSIVRFRQLDLALFMNDDETGAELGYRLKTDYKPEELSPGCCAADFLEVNLGILCYGAVRKTKRKVYLSQAKASHAYITEVVKKGNPNMVNFVSLLDAERATLKGRTAVAKKCYEKAISQAARRGCVNYQAVANERFGDYMAECSDNNEAEYRWKHAKDLFAEWGAIVKVEQIERKIASISSESSECAGI